MENQSLNDLLFQFLQGKCAVESHSGNAIYYCMQSACEKRLICTECLTEDSTHFTSHLKSFLPLDQKQKFVKYLGLNNTEPELKRQIDINNLVEKEKEKIANYYNLIEKEVLEVIRQHKSDYLNVYESQFKENLQLSVQSLTDLDKDKDTIEEFVKTIIQSNNRDEFATNYTKIKEKSIEREEKINKINSFLNGLECEEINFTNKQLVFTTLLETIDENVNSHIKINLNSKTNAYASENNQNLLPNSSRRNKRLALDESYLETHSNLKKETEDFIHNLEEMSTPTNEKSKSLKMRLEALKNRIKDI